MKQPDGDGAGAGLPLGALEVAEQGVPAGYTADVSKRQKRPRRVSHQDIAREANVSRVTVSLVLAGKDQASAETTEIAQTR